MVHMVGAGLFLGISLDTYFRLRGKLKGSVLLLIQDLLFWLLSGLIIFLWLLKVNGGEVRLYLFAAIAFGFVLYRRFLGTYYRRLLNLTIHVILSLYRFIITLISLVIIRPVRLLIMLITAIMGFFGGLLLGGGRWLAALLSKMWRRLKGGFFVLVTNKFKKK